MDENDVKDGLEAPDAEVNAGEEADPATEGADAVAAPETEEEGEEGAEIGGDEAVA